MTTYVTRLTLLGALTLFAAGSLPPATAQAQPTVPGNTKPAPAKNAVAALYECPMCHEKVTAARARKQHMLCACCHEKLVPVKTARAEAKAAPKG